MSSENSGADRCPICGGGNRCGNVEGKPAGSCWCSKEVFPPEIFDLLTPEQRGVVCICAGCLSRFQRAKKAD